MSSKALQFLEQRRLAVGVSCQSLAKQAGLGLRTVQRALSGDGSDVSLSTFERIAGVLGVRATLEMDDVNDVLRRRAEAKADRVVALVQGTMGLEAQAVDEAALRELRERTVRDLLRGSPRKLWAE